MTKKSDAPAIRFKGFSDAWEQRKLRELALFNPKDELPQTFEYVDLESVVGTEMLSHRAEVKSSAPSRAQRLAHTGDLFYQTVRPYQKNNYLFEKPDNNYVFSTGYAQMRPYVDGYFLLSLVQSERFVKVVLDNCTGTSYPAINANDLAEIEVAAPSDESEAQKIGTIFRSIDNLITLHQRQPFLHSTPEISLTVQLIHPFYTSSWEQRKVSDLAEKTYGGGTPTTSNEAYWNGDIPWIQSSDVVDGKLLGVEPRKWITQDGLINSAAQLIPGNSIAIITRVGVGKLAFMPYSYATSQDFLSLSKLNAEPLFTVYACYKKLQSELNAVQGTSIKGITKDELLAKNIMVPRYAEQQQIGAFFKQLDHLITLHQRKCISFTGRAGRLISTVNKKRITSSWEQRKVQDVSDRFDNLRIPVAANLRVHGTTPYYGANGIQDYVEGFTHDGEFVLVAEDGANDLKNYPVKCVNGRIWVNNHAHILQGKAGIADNSFLAFAISQSDIESLLVGGGRAKLNAETLMSIEFRLPCLQEQYRIGEYLTQLDHLITLHQRKFEKLTNVKKSMLEKMFPQNGSSYPEIRFKGFTDPWEQRKLEDYLTVSTEKNTGNIYGRSDVLSVSGDYGIVNQIEFQGRSFAGASVLNYGVVQTGDVVYTKSPLNSNPYGIIKTNKGKPGIVSTLYAVYHPKENTFSDFIQVYFEQHARMNNYMHPLVNKGAKNDMKVSSENALKGQVCFPSRVEQESISAFFSVLDNLITLHQRKGKAAVTGCSNDANNSKGVYCKARDFGYKCYKEVKSQQIRCLIAVFIFCV